MKIIEAEGAGVGRAARSHRDDVPFVVIRGVSDRADSATNKLEEESKHRFVFCPTERY